MISRFSMTGAFVAMLIKGVILLPRLRRYLPSGQALALFAAMNAVTWPFVWAFVPAMTWDGSHVPGIAFILESLIIAQVVPATERARTIMLVWVANTSSLMLGAFIVASELSSPGMGVHTECIMGGMMAGVGLFFGTIAITRKGKLGVWVNMALSLFFVFVAIMAITGSEAHIPEQALAQTPPLPFMVERAKAKAWRRETGSRFGPISFVSGAVVVAYVLLRRHKRGAKT